MESTQGIIFEQTAQPIVDVVLQGFNGTVFAYGQTGTGKSYTMEGARSDDSEGIIPRTFEYIFHHIAQQSGEQTYLVRAAYCEIHNEEIRDLLSKDPKKRLHLKESLERGVYVHGLKQIVVNGAQELHRILALGKRHRAVGATQMNDTSSRSHAIFSLVVECRDAVTEGDAHIRVGKLNLVDLAGSERQSKTGTTGARLKEGIQINLSLTALGNVISSLVDAKQTHIPYRDSKLTRLLQDSLGGNTKTVMIANIGPVEWNLEETLSTLRYANRAKNIQNKPVINEDPKDAMLRQYQEEISRLKAELAQKTDSQSQGSNRRRQLREELETQIRAELQTEAEEQIHKRAEAEANKRLESLTAERDASVVEGQQSTAALKDQQQELTLYAAKVEEERRQRGALQERIYEMESKVLHGGVNLLERMEALDKRNAETKATLAAQKEQQREQKRRFDALQDIHLLTEQKFNSLEEEAEIKSRKLKLVAARYQAKLEELSDLQWEFEQERASWQEATTKLRQSLKLKQCIIDSFIPPRYQQKIAEHLHYDAEQEQWHIDAATYTGNARRQRQGPPELPEQEPFTESVYLSYEDVAPVELRPLSRQHRKRRVSRRV